MFKIVKAAFTIVWTILAAVFSGLAATLGAAIIIAGFILQVRYWMGLGVLLGTSLFMTRSLMLTGGLVVGVFVTYLVSKALSGRNVAAQDVIVEELAKREAAKKRVSA